jgi:hypothetical protein
MGEGRRHPHEVSVTTEEEAKLIVRAEARGVTIPRLLVESALADEGTVTATDRHDELTELFRVRRLLAAVSNNVNQIARAVNSGESVTGELTHTLAVVRSSCDRIDGYLGQVSRS